MDRMREGGQVTGKTPFEAEPLALAATGIVKTYRSPGGVLEVLKGIDLEVKRGTILAVLGVSGAGKSTLLNILGTLDRPDSGTLAIRGERVDGLGEEPLARFRARRIGFVFQFHHLLPEFTAEENVMMPLLIAGENEARARARARASLTAVGLSARWEHRPAELSGGEAQRVAVARALAPEPELVLADEPSGNLDPGAARQLQDLLASLARDKHQTFVIVTHNDRLASLADRVLTLESGRLVASA
jgi:lipoprotein-releasing system ATP-binding protein